MVAAGARSSRSCASATSNVYVEDKGDVFNSDLTQAIELGNMLDTALCMVHRRDRAQGEPRRARAAVRLSDARRRELPQALDHALARRRRRALDEATCGSRSGSPRSGSTDARRRSRSSCCCSRSRSARRHAAAARSRRRRRRSAADGRGDAPRRRRPQRPGACKLALTAAAVGRTDDRRRRRTAASTRRSATGQLQPATSTRAGSPARSTRC